MNNPMIARRTIVANYTSQKHLIEGLLGSGMAPESSIINISSKLVNPMLFRNKEIRKRVFEFSTVEDLDSLAEDYISDLENGNPWMSPRQLVPDYKLSKLLFRLYTLDLAKNNEIVRDKRIKVVSVCPGWVRTAMGGSQASLSIEESIEKLSSVLSGAFFESHDLVDYQGELISDDQIIGLK